MKAITISLIMYLSLTNAQHIKIRAYTVNNKINSFLKIVPHVAIEVQTCYDNNMTCSLTSYGKAKNGKIYSPDILTVGRSNNNSKFVPSGYNIKNITDWKPVSNRLFKSFIFKNFKSERSYNFINNNCATFVSKFMNHMGIKYSCRVGIFDIPNYCY